MGLGTDDGEANVFVDEATPLATGVPVAGWEIGALEESKAEGCVHGESFVLTRRFYHSRGATSPGVHVAHTFWSASH